MIQHIVLFRLNESVDDLLVSDLMANFEALPAAIPEIEHLEVGRDIVGRPVSCHFGLVSRFADREALQRYQAHPVHVAAFERTKAHLDHMLVLDYELEA
ncbi:MAG: Dabb family protein [Chloroflexota bacterium]|nr:Dabb family protein [Chloroflexota bacterium]